MLMETRPILRGRIHAGVMCLLGTKPDACGVVQPRVSRRARRGHDEHEKDAYAQRRKARACDVTRFVVFHLRNLFPG